MSIFKGVALVTGSAQGIGRGIALRLARDGFDIALNDVASKRDQLRAVADDIEKLGQKTCVVPADVSIDKQVKEMVQDTSKKLGGLNVMVANAGIGYVSELVSTEVDEWERVMAINARGTFLCYKHAAMHMIAQGRGGRIIGASSVTAMMGHPLVSAYGASKFAVRGLTQTAAHELGRYKITVNAYAPGLIKTPMSATMSDPDGQFANADKELSEWFRNNIEGKPIKRDGQPEDIAAIVSYLASEDASFITGKYLPDQPPVRLMMFVLWQDNALALMEGSLCLERNIASGCDTTVVLNIS